MRTLDAGYQILNFEASERLFLSVKVGECLIRGFGQLLAAKCRSYWEVFESADGFADRKIPQVPLAWLLQADRAAMLLSYRCATAVWWHATAAMRTSSLLL